MKTTFTATLLRPYVVLVLDSSEVKDIREDTNEGQRTSNNNVKYKKIQNKRKKTNLKAVYRTSYTVYSVLYKQTNYWDSAVVGPTTT